ncbi:precorrin-8X methylmutase, partial [Lachnotalea glycerini]
MKIELENVLPKDIEKRSFEIITKELNGQIAEDEKASIIKRVIHTSADFEYAKTLMFSEQVVKKSLEAIKRGACRVTDRQMGKAGINKKSLAKFGGEVYCFMSDEDVAEKAKENK